LRRDAGEDEEAAVLGTRRARRLSVGPTIALFGIVAVLGTASYLFSYQAANAEKARVIQVEAEDVHRTATALTNFFRHYGKDLTLLVHLPETVAFVERGFLPAESAREVEAHLANFLASRPEYYQARIIAATGWEVIRVNQGIDRTISIVGASDLQYKGDRYYFAEAMQLDQDAQYYSPIDLNIENGVIEVPHVPVLRIASPLVSSSGEKLGILILNVYAGELFNILSRNMFLETQGDYRFTRTAQGEIDVEETDQGGEDESLAPDLAASRSRATLSEVVELVPGYAVTVGKLLDLGSIRADFALRIFGMFGALLVASVLTFLVTVIHYRRGRKLVGVQTAMIDALALLATERDQESGLHLERVRKYSVALAKELRNDEQYRSMISQDFLDDLDLAGPLHDIGKVGIPDSILLKPGPLDEGEWEIMKTHTRVGAEVLQTSIARFDFKDRYLFMATNICLHHHERFDGSGYPDGLQNGEIPLEARIFAVVDAYDAIRSRRPYKEPIPHEEAVMRIKRDAGSHFDPNLVNAFLRCEGQFKETSETLAD
jgi:putative two-component system response regulator